MLNHCLTQTKSIFFINKKRLKEMLLLLIVFLQQTYIYYPANFHRNNLNRRQHFFYLNFLI
jgi:hypothetical protein